MIRMRRATMTTTMLMALGGIRAAINKGRKQHNKNLIN